MFERGVQCRGCTAVPDAARTSGEDASVAPPGPGTVRRLFYLEETKVFQNCARSTIVAFALGLTLVIGSPLFTQGGFFHVVDLGTLGGESRANGIDEKGIVCGRSIDGAGVWR